jgi:hypothetical protein
MGLLNNLRTRLRRFKGERVERGVPERSLKPRIGSHVIHVQKGLRLVVQAGMSDDLWKWLMDHGWRVSSFRPERRSYGDIPASYVTRLIDADPAQRKKLMVEATMNAQSRDALVRKQASSD